MGILVWPWRRGPKVISDHINRFPAHDFLYVCLPSQTSRTNNKPVISTFKFGYPCLTLKEGSKVKSDHTKRFPAHDFLQVGLPSQTCRTNNKGDISTFHDWQRNTCGSHLVFQNEAKNIPSQDFIMRNISCEFEISTYNTLCSRGPTKVLVWSQINVPGGHLVFQNEAKNIPRQHFMVINISCKLEKASYNIFFHQSSNDEISLHTAAIQWIQWFTQQWEPESSYCSAMPWHTGLQCYSWPKIMWITYLNKIL